MDPRFRISSNGVQWIVDERNRVIGFMDADKKEYLVPSTEDADKIAGSQERPDLSSVSGGGNVAISANTVLTAAAHANKDIFATGTPQLTINTGLGDTFGLNVFGAFTYTGSATITDKRVSGAANPSASLVHTPATDTYEWHGSKP